MFKIAGDSFNLFLVIICVIGGLGLFLYGIHMMGDALKLIAGKKMKTIIEKSTDKPIKGVLVGIIVTIILQSSSGTQALVISLVRTGLMTLAQSIGVVLGSNVGTCVTAFLVGLKIEKYALIFVGVGTLMVFFFKKKKVVNIGKAILGFGFLFFGLDLMSIGLHAIFDEFPAQTEALFTFLAQYPVLAYLVGIVFTAGIQSSAATIVIVQSLYCTGKVPLGGAIAIVLGANLGTCITGVLASLGGTRESKQVAFISVFVKLVWTILFMFLLIPYTYLMQLIENGILVKAFGEKPAMTIAIGQLLFNILVCFITMFIIPPIVKLANIVIRDKSENASVFSALQDYSLIHKSPILALEFAKKNIDYMATEVENAFDLARNFAFVYDNTALEKGQKIEQTINSLDKRIHDYLIKLTRESIDKETSNLISKYLETISNLERIGDHCANLLEFADERYSNKISLSEEGTAELNTIFNKAGEMISYAHKSFVSGDKMEANVVLDDEEDIDELEKLYRRHHFDRIKRGKCSNENGDIFIETISNLERIGDHCDNIANTVIYEKYCEVSEYNH